MTSTPIANPFMAWTRIRESHRSAAVIIRESADKLRDLGDDAGAAVCTKMVAELDALAFAAGKKATEANAAAICDFIDGRY